MHTSALVWPVRFENFPPLHSVQEGEALLLSYFPAAQGAQTKLVLKKEEWPGLHDVHAVGHAVEDMSAGVATRLCGEEPSVPAGHPFVTIAEAVQERVPVEANVLSGQVRSSLAAPSR